MAQVITTAGEQLFAIKAQNNQPLDIDTFIFAYVPGQDSSATIDRNEGLPPVGQRVHQQIVQQRGRVNSNVVIYSTVLDSVTGPFEFNWVGLYSSVNNTLVAISKIPTVVKTVTVPGTAGNILNRNFGIEYSGIADLDGITVDPETWQLDYTARLAGMEELTRQLAADMNGRDWFIDNGFKVEPLPTPNNFKVTAGAGYVSGLRIAIEEEPTLIAASYPQFVYVNAWFDGTSEATWKGQTTFQITPAEQEDYTDETGKRHYLFKLATITAANTVIDHRSGRATSTHAGIKYLLKVPGIKQTTLSFHTGLGVGGGDYIWLPDADQSKHLKLGPNGGVLWSAAALDLHDGTPATLKAVLNWEGVGYGCFEMLIGSDHVHTSFFGAVNDPSIDSSLPTEIACKVAKEELLKDAVYLNKKQGFGYSVYVPTGITVYGTGRYNDCRPLLIDGELKFILGWMFLFNTKDGINWIDPFPNSPTGGLKNARLNNPQMIPGVRFAVGFGSCEFDKLRGYYPTQMVKRPLGMYTDNFVTRTIYAEPVMGNDHQVEIRGLGDGMIVEGLHFPWNPDNPGDGVPNGLFVAASLGGRISECIGGNTYITQGTVTIENGHYERGQLTIDGANASCNKTVFSAHEKLPIKLIGSGNQSYSLNLDNCEFMYLAGKFEWQGSDIQASDRFTISVKETYRKWTKNGSVDKMQLSGIQIEKSDGSPVQQWNDFSYIHSRDGLMYANYSVSMDFSVSATDKSFVGLTSADLDNATTWEEATGTYFYRSQILLDKNRLIGRNQTSSEISINQTLGSSGNRLACSLQDRKRTGILRVYRGLSSGNYDKYVDIHLFNTNLLYDNGTEVNGIPWISRTAGPVQALNAIGEKSITYRDENVTCHAITIPTLGNWVVGDDIMRVAVQSGQFRGFTYTEDFTWLGFGQSGNKYQVGNDAFTSDSSGFIDVPHELGASPAFAVAVPENNNLYHIDVVSRNVSNFRVQVRRRSDNAAVANAPIFLLWNVSI